MLTMRTRGKNGTLYIRGTVKLGEEQVVVPEYSSGTSEPEAATYLMRQHETDLMRGLMFGPAASIAKGVLADAFAFYLSRVPSPCGGDVLRIGKLNDVIGGCKLKHVNDAWTQFRKGLENHAPRGQDRYRSVLQAAVNAYHLEKNVDPIKLKAIGKDIERVRWLHKDDRDRLISSYSPHVQPIITMLAFHGPRTQDALQICWGNEGVDMERGVIRFEHMKTTSITHVPIHPRVHGLLQPLWLEAGKPNSGHVFLNRLGNPYQDTRKAKIPGGNPLSRAHKTATRRAGIKDFTVHDWRHAWASQMIMSGVDGLTLMYMGGWKSMRMVERYVTLSAEHYREAVNKLD